MRRSVVEKIACLLFTLVYLGLLTSCARPIRVDGHADKNTISRAPTVVSSGNTVSFTKLNSWFAKDANGVYLVNQRIPGADAASFKLQSCGRCEVCAEDKNRCYWFGHPVPCDCKPHSEDDFAEPMTDIPSGNGLLRATGPITVDLEEATDASFFHGMSAGYLRVDAGKHKLSLKCSNDDHSESLKFAIAVEPARLYRLQPREGTTCGVELLRPALVQGKVDGPEIQIRTTRDTKPKSQIELPPGKHKFTAVCRTVTRTGVKESYGEVTATLQPGRIYRLDASDPASATCPVQIYAVN